MSTLLLFGSFSVLPAPSPWTTASHWRQKQTNKFFPPAPFILPLPLLATLASRATHVHCLWPLPCILLVCTTLVCVLFVATILLL